MRKSDNWESSKYVLVDTVNFDSIDLIDLILGVEEIYYYVHNDNMLTYLQNSQTSYYSQNPQILSAV